MSIGDDPRDADAAADADAFVAGWRERWPEWAIAEVFVPPPRRAPAQAWLALLQVLGDAAWGGADPRPGEAKLGWWAEELVGWSRGARRHPLGRLLATRAASWRAVAAALPALQASRDRPRDTTAAVAAVAPFAVAAAAVESELTATPATTIASGDLASALLAERLLHHRDEAVPLQLLSAGPGEGTRAWASALLDAWPAGPPVARPRRIHAMLLRARLGQLARGVDAPAPLPRVATAWRAWHAARMPADGTPRPGDGAGARRPGR